MPRTMRWVRSWIASITLIYPAYWLATTLVWVVPGLLRSLAGERIDFGITPFGAYAFGAMDGGAWAGLFALAAAGSLFLVEGPGRAFCGLIMTGAGLAAFSPIMRFGRMGHSEKLPVLISILLIAGGLRMLLAGAPESGYLGRVLFLFTTIALPLLVAPALLFRGPRGEWSHFLNRLAVVAGSSLIVSLRRPSIPRRGLGWMAAVAGLVASVGLAVITPRAGAEVRERQNRMRAESGRAAIAQLPAVEVNAPYPKVFFQRGVSLTAEGPGGYTSEMARETLRMLPAYGVNAIALVPYGSIRAPRAWGGGGMESDEGIEQLTRVAHASGMKVMLKPQLWGGTWPADFDVANEAERRVWFDQYAGFIEHYAQLAARNHIDIVCVGTELSKMARHPEEWRKIIARVRGAYNGPLTYAAVQGPEFETLSFWDALDYIGLSNYYPLPDNLDTSDIVRRVEAVQKKFNKPVIFAEAGFSSVVNPNREPWADNHAPVSMDGQRRCYEALYQAFYKKPWFQGVYWWKLGTNRFGGAQDTSHTPWGKPAMEVIRRWYTQGGR